MATPTYEANNITSTDASGTSWDVNLPSGMTEGETIIVMVGVRRNLGTETASTPANWTTIHDSGENETQLLAFWRKVETGWKTDTTVTVSITASAACSAISYRFSGAADPDVSPPEGDSAFSDTADINPDPPALDPAGGVKDIKWIAAYYHRDSATASVWPYGADASNPTDTMMESCSDDLAQDSEDPDQYTTGSSPWTAITIAVHPAAGVDYVITVLTGPTIPKIV
jgi:hypothetical protein